MASRVKEIAKFKRDVSLFVPDVVNEALKENISIVKRKELIVEELEINYMTVNRENHNLPKDEKVVVQANDFVGLTGYAKAGFKIGDQVKVKRGYKGQERKGINVVTFEEIELTGNTSGKIVDFDIYGCDYIIQVESEDFEGMLIAVYENDIMLAK